MRHVSSLAAGFLLALACARGNSPADDTSSAAAARGQDVKAAMVANAIAAKPAAADSILRANGYTAESFEKDMYDIAADSTRSAAYVAAKAR